MSDGKLKERDYFIVKEPGPASENGFNAAKLPATPVKDGKVPGTAGGKK